MCNILFVVILLCNIFCLVVCENFNLIGEAGQAYSIEINIGKPQQKLSVIVDTGSTTLAIAAYPQYKDDIYFTLENSSTLFNAFKEVQAKYSQGMWVGKLVSDLVQIPSLPAVPEVRSDFALITKSQKFFSNGSGWQGLLGLAYLPVSAWGENVVVESWLDSVERKLNRPLSFQLKLCGVQSQTNATHYGHFGMLDDNTLTKHPNKTFRTPIIRKCWYEVGVLAVRVIEKSEKNITSQMGNKTNRNDVDVINDINIDMCRNLNKEKSIIDSGTTNIRLPDLMFTKVVDELKSVAQRSNAYNNAIVEEFWYNGEAACWPEPQTWSLPWLAIDLLSDESDYQYFTLEIPPQSYMRVITARNATEGKGMPEFCYQLGLDAGGSGTVLGYTAMEGFQVLFNRSAGWISFQTSDCGPHTRITGPFNVSTSIVRQCNLAPPLSEAVVSIKAAQWALCAVSTVAAGVLLYILAPCIKMYLMKSLPRSQQISMSQASLVNKDT